MVIAMAAALAIISIFFIVKLLLNLFDQQVAEEPSSCHAGRGPWEKNFTTRPAAYVQLRR
jgi:hypothetical protein